MRKAFWPLVVALGLLVVFGAISTSGIQKANAEINTLCEENVETASCVWYIDEFGLPDTCTDEGLLVEDIQVSEEQIDENDVIWLFLEDQDAVWICVDLTDGNDFDLEFDSNNYGTWEEVLCLDLEGECSATNGLGTNTLLVDCFETGECETEDDEGDVAALFVCDEAGEAEVTITHDADAVQFRIICWGEADDGEIVAVPTKVEIVPALGSTQYSLIYVQLFDEDGNAAAPGAEVTWMTDNCQIADNESVIEDTLDEDDLDLAPDTFDEIIDIFEAYDDNPTPSTADDVEDYVEDVLDPDWDDEAELETFIEEPFDLDDPFEDLDVYTATILNCGQGHDSEPGIATVTAIVEVIDGADLVFEVDVTVVGPPAGPIVVAADQTSVRCGERVQITVTVKDSQGQNVSDHTLVEAVTNFGGVLGGTGAVAGQQGLVTPISSTLAETFNGVATFWLLTSETHSGPYEVLISTGGGGAVAGQWFGDEGDEGDEHQLLGGLFSTPVVNGRVSVACTIPAAVAPAPAATVRAPSTGQGIVPPNTGDAGLADASGSSWALFVIAGVGAFALAGVASVKFARR
ncbi:MAG: hypothetical protein GEU75_00840 [Dehalococcoidia bacterium]|nr:hypothetical protein [Dehalococcoidia bacterium]